MKLLKWIADWSFKIGAGCVVATMVGGLLAVGPMLIYRGMRHQGGARDLVMVAGGVVVSLLLWGMGLKGAVEIWETRKE